LRAIAAGLEERGIPAARGGKWSATQVMRLLEASRPFEGGKRKPPRKKLSRLRREQRFKFVRLEDGERADRCRENAVECKRMAMAVTDQTIRSIYLDLAKEWTAKAEEAEELEG
jgi:hypothetical protein